MGTTCSWKTTGRLVQSEGPPGTAEDSSADGPGGPSETAALRRHDRKRSPGGHTADADARFQRHPLLLQGWAKSGERFNSAMQPGGCQAV